MRVSFSTFEKFHNRPIGTIGSTKIRCRWVWENWPEAEEYRIGIKYDVMIFQKVYWDTFAKDFKGVKILDMCDPDWEEGAKVVEFIQIIDAVTTSTEPLAKAIRKFTDKPVVCIPDRIDFKHNPIINRKHNGDAKKAFWFGYAQNLRTLDQTLDILNENGYELTIYSNQAYYPNTSFNLKINNIPVETGDDYDSKLREIAKDQDLLLNPKIAEAKFRYKSNNKTILAWSMGLPVVDEEPEDLVK